VSRSLDSSACDLHTGGSDSQKPAPYSQVTGCIETRHHGSLGRIECGKGLTMVPVHAGEDSGPGLLRRIERDLEPCLGKGWLKKS
jgi:predicted RNA binding protein YcfA (HicA-like mRNA interferase family)